MLSQACAARTTSLFLAPRIPKSGDALLGADQEILKREPQPRVNATAYSFKRNHNCGVTVVTDSSRGLAA